MVRRLLGDLCSLDPKDLLLTSVQTRCIVKGEAQKSPLFWRFSGGFDFLRIACSLGIPQANLQI